MYWTIHTIPVTTNKPNIFRLCNQYNTFPCRVSCRAAGPSAPRQCCLAGSHSEDARGTRISVPLSEIGCCERISVTDTFSFLAGEDNFKLLLHATTPSHQKVTIHPLSPYFKFTDLIRIACQHRVTF